MQLLQPLGPQLCRGPGQPRCRCQPIARRRPQTAARISRERVDLPVEVTKTTWDGVARPQGSGRIVQQAILLALSTSRQSQALLLLPSSPSPTRAVIFGCGFLCRPENYMAALEALVEAGAVVIAPYAPLVTDLPAMDVPGMHRNANVVAKSVMTTMVDMLRAAVFLGHELPNHVQGVKLDGIIIMGHSIGAGSGLIVAPHIKDVIAVAAMAPPFKDFQSSTIVGYMTPGTCKGAPAYQDWVAAQRSAHEPRKTMPRMDDFVQRFSNVPVHFFHATKDKLCDGELMADLCRELHKARGGRPACAATVTVAGAHMGFLTRPRLKDSDVWTSVLAWLYYEYEKEVLAWSFTSRKAAVSALQSQAAWVVQQLQSLLDGCTGQHQQLLANNSQYHAVFQGIAVGKEPRLNCDFLPDVTLRAAEIWQDDPVKAIPEAWSQQDSPLKTWALLGTLGVLVPELVDSLVTRATTYGSDLATVSAGLALLVVFLSWVGGPLFCLTMLLLAVNAYAVAIGWQVADLISHGDLLIAVAFAGMFSMEHLLLAAGSLCASDEKLQHWRRWLTPLHTIRLAAHSALPLLLVPMSVLAAKHGVSWVTTWAGRGFLFGLMLNLATASILRYRFFFQLVPRASGGIGYYTYAPIGSDTTRFWPAVLTAAVAVVLSTQLVLADGWDFGSLLMWAVLLAMSQLLPVRWRPQWLQASGNTLLLENLCESYFVFALVDHLAG